MRFVDCELRKPGQVFIDLSGFEVSVIVLEMIVLENAIEKYFAKLKGISNFNEAVLVTSKKLRTLGLDDMMRVHILISFPDKVIKSLSDDLESLGGDGLMFGPGDLIIYEDTFNKLIILKREIAKLFDKNHVLPVVFSNDIQECKREDIFLNN